jgi:hypothetical protein
MLATTEERQSSHRTDQRDPAPWPPIEKIVMAANFTASSLVRCTGTVSR